MKFEVEVEDKIIEELKIKMDSEYDNNPTDEDVMIELLYLGAANYGHDDIANIKKVE